MPTGVVVRHYEQAASVNNSQSTARTQEVGADTVFLSDEGMNARIQARESSDLGAHNALGTGSAAGVQVSQGLGRGRANPMASVGICVPQLPQLQYGSALDSGNTSVRISQGLGRGRGNPLIDVPPVSPHRELPVSGLLNQCFNDSQSTGQRQDTYNNALGARNEILRSNQAGRSITGEVPRQDLALGGVVGDRESQPLGTGLGKAQTGFEAERQQAPVSRVQSAGSRHSEVLTNRAGVTTQALFREQQDQSVNDADTSQNISHQRPATAAAHDTACDSNSKDDALSKDDELEDEVKEPQVVREQVPEVLTELDVVNDQALIAANDRKKKRKKCNASASDDGRESTQQKKSTPRQKGRKKGGRVAEKSTRNDSDTGEFSSGSVTAQSSSSSDEDSKDHSDALSSSDEEVKDDGKCVDRVNKNAGGSKRAEAGKKAEKGTKSSKRHKPACPKRARNVNKSQKSAKQPRVTTRQRATKKN